MEFSAFRATKAFKGLFDDVAGLSADLERSAGHTLTSKEIGAVFSKDTRFKTQLRNALETYTKEAARDGIGAVEAQTRFVNGIIGQFPSETRKALSKETAEKELDAVRSTLDALVTDTPQKPVLPAARRAERVAKPTGVVDGLLRNPDKLANFGGPYVTQTLRTYEQTLEPLIVSIKRDGVKELSKPEREAIRAVNGAFEKESKEAGRGITAAQRRENFLDAIDLPKGSKARHDLAELLEKSGSESKVKTGPKPRQEPTLDEQAPTPQKTPALDEADIARTKELKAAEATVSNSLLDMDTVRKTNGKMPKQAFFAELQNALRETGQLVPSRAVLDIGDEIARTPAQVYARIQHRSPVQESEVRVLAEYFGRYHNDAKAAKELAANPAPLAPLAGGRGVAGIAEAVIRRIPISEGTGRTTATIAQSRAWETAETSFLNNRISYFQEKPIRASVSALALATSAFLTQQTISTVSDFEDPTYWGREIIGIVKKDKAPAIEDYAEYIFDRYNANPKAAFRALEERYGISESDISDNNVSKIVAALSKAPILTENERGSPKLDTTTSDEKAALYMFVSQRLYGQAVGRGQDLTNLKAESDASKANEDAAKRSAIAQAGINNTAVLRPMTYGNEQPVEPAYSEYEVDGESFDNRAKGMTSGNPALYDALTKVFKDVTKAPVQPQQELTAENKMTKGEAITFAEEAKLILAKQKVDPERAEQMVQLLIEPSISAPTPAPSR